MLSDSQRERVREWAEQVRPDSIKASDMGPWADGPLFAAITEAMATPFAEERVDKVAGPESRGFYLGGALALRLGAGFVPVRKGALPSEPAIDVDRETFVDYSDRGKALELERHAHGLRAGDRVLLVDDWSFSGAQGLALIRLVERQGATVVGLVLVIDQMSAEVRSRFHGYRLVSLVELAP